LKWKSNEHATSLVATAVQGKRWFSTGDKTSHGIEQIDPWNWRVDGDRVISSLGDSSQRWASPSAQPNLPGFRDIGAVAVAIVFMDMLET